MQPVFFPHFWFWNLVINPDVQQRFLGIWSGSGPDGLLADCCFLVACTSVENRVLLFLYHKLSKRHMDFFSCWNDGTEDKGHVLQWIMYYEFVDSFTRKRIKLLQDNGMFFFPTFSWKEILKLLGSCSHLTHFYKEFAANELSMVWCQCWEVVEMVHSISNLWGVEIAWAAHAVCFQDLNLSVSIFVSWPLWPHLTFCLWISNMFCTLPWSTGLSDQGMFDHLACGLPAFLMEFLEPVRGIQEHCWTKMSRGKGPALWFQTSRGCSQKRLQ